MQQVDIEEDEEEETQVYAVDVKWSTEQIHMVCIPLYEEFLHKCQGTERYHVCVQKVRNVFIFLLIYNVHGELQVANGL